MSAIGITLEEATFFVDWIQQGKAIYCGQFIEVRFWLKLIDVVPFAILKVLNITFLAFFLVIWFDLTSVQT